MANILLAFLLFIMKFQSGSSKQHAVSGVVIALNKFTVEDMKDGSKNALASRAASFYQGFVDVGIPCVIQSFSDAERMKTLSQTYSHVIVIEWPKNFMYQICNQKMGEALFSFNVTAMQTIEAAYKIKTSHTIWNQAKPWTDEICTKEIYKNYSVYKRFSMAMLWYDIVLVGLRHEVVPFRKAVTAMYEHHRIYRNVLRLTSVQYCPVPVETAFWQPSSKPLDHLRVFFDWDNRSNIAVFRAAKVILEAIELIRSRADLPYRNGVQVISTIPLPEELKNCTLVDVPDSAVNGKVNHSIFIDIISSCHIYATAIKSSYENPVVEAQMGGAMLVSLCDIITFLNSFV
jgi:hypothetical protein